MSRAEKQVKAAAAAVGKCLSADVLLFNGSIDRGNFELLNECCRAARGENVFLVIVSEGGDADAGYRMARSLLRAYKRVYVAIGGYCKSAGTLVAIGAHELIISDDGELGPLDVQLLKSDELWEQRSGQTVTDALDVLQQKAFDMFQKTTITLKYISDGQVTLKTAMQIATSLVTGLFREAYSQIDQMYVGEVGRAMSIASEYGRRLADDSGNLSDAGLNRLVASYPSHGFVIDRQEAQEIFPECSRAIGRRAGPARCSRKTCEGTGTWQGDSHSTESFRR